MKNFKATWIFLLLLLPCALMAQEKGIHFEHGLTFAQIKEKAKAENKYIFVDCFTTWCGPCKMMASLVFPLDTVGEYFNSKFISVKLQIDKTAGDNADVKALYNDIPEIEKAYDVHAYPTFLFFAPDGRIVHKFVGSVPFAAGFLTKVNEVFDPSMQYFTLLGRFYADPVVDADATYKLAMMADRNHDYKNITILSNAYLGTQKDLYTKKNLEFIYEFTQKSKDKMFPFVLAHGSKIDSSLGKGSAEQKIQEIALEEDKILAGTTPDWAKKQVALEKKYPGYGKELSTRFQMEYFLSEKKWAPLNATMLYYEKQYPSGMILNEISFLGSRIFDTCPDEKCLQTVTAWVKKGVDTGDLNSQFAYCDLLYKTGDKAGAIAILEAFLSHKNVTDGSLQEELSKMKRGEKIWEN